MPDASAHGCRNRGNSDFSPFSYIKPQIKKSIYHPIGMKEKHIAMKFQSQLEGTSTDAPMPNAMLAD